MRRQDTRRGLAGLCTSAARRLPEAGERHLAGLHARVLRPGSGAGESGPPRGRAVRVLGRYRLGAGASGHGGVARSVYAPGRGGGRPGADAALPWVCGEQLYIQLVGAIPG